MMNQKFIESIPSYLKEFNLSNKDIQNEIKWIEDKIIVSFQNSLKELMQEKQIEGLNESIQNQSIQQQSSLNSQSNTIQQEQNKSRKYNKINKNISCHLIDEQIIKSQMRINEQQYPKLFPKQSQQQQLQVKTELSQKSIPYLYTNHNISTQSTNVPHNTTINGYIHNKSNKRSEHLSINLHSTVTAEDDNNNNNNIPISAFSVNSLNSNNNNINNYQNKQGHSNYLNQPNKLLNRSLQNNKRLNSSLTRESQSSSYAEQQRKKKQYQVNNNNNKSNDQSINNNNNKSFCSSNSNNNTLKNNEQQGNNKIQQSIIGNKKSIGDINLPCSFDM